MQYTAFVLIAISEASHTKGQKCKAQSHEQRCCIFRINIKEWSRAFQVLCIKVVEHHHIRQIPNPELQWTVSWHNRKQSTMKAYWKWLMSSPLQYGSGLIFN